MTRSESYSLLLDYAPDEAKRFFRDAHKFCASHHQSGLNYIACNSMLRPADITPEKFFSEYVWCIMASGFNARVVYDKFQEIRRVLKGFDLSSVNPTYIPRSGMRVIANKAKWDAVASCVRLLKSTQWDEFRSTYMTSVDAMEKLPRIGPVVKYHLARNLGFDVVKPDLHLQRVADRFKAASPDGFCRSIQLSVDEAGLLTLGQIDYCVWCFLSHAGKVRTCCFREDPETLSLR